MGRTAILHAFARGARVIADPVLTSTSYPYLPSTPSDPAALPWSGPTPPIAGAGDLGPVVAQALTAILEDVGDASAARAIVSAFAAGAALATEQLPVLGVVESVQRDFRGVLLDTASVVAALPRPHEVIGEGIRNAVKVLPVIAPAPIAVPGFVPPPGPDTDAPVIDAPVIDAPAADGSGASSGIDDLRVASPLTDRRTGRVDDGLGEQAVEPAEPVEPVEPAEPVEPVEPAEPVEPVEPVEPAEPVADEEISVDDKPAGRSPSGIADALGLTQRAQRASGEAASPGIKQRAGRAAR
jgi:hypothetical protein